MIQDGICIFLKWKICIFLLRLEPILHRFGEVFGEDVEEKPTYFFPSVLKKSIGRTMGILAHSYFGVGTYQLTSYTRGTGKFSKVQIGVLCPKKQAT